METIKPEFMVFKTKEDIEYKVERIKLGKVNETVTLPLTEACRKAGIQIYEISKDYRVRMRQPMFQTEVTSEVNGGGVLSYPARVKESNASGNLAMLELGLPFIGTTKLVLSANIYAGAPEDAITELIVYIPQ